MHLRNPLKKMAFDDLPQVEPIFIKGSTQKGVLLLHSYTSNPLEFREMARFLAEQGFTVYAPVIAGHGTHPDDLIETSINDWEHSVEAAYMTLADHVDKVYVIGSSFGGNLAFMLAAKGHQKISGLVSLGTPVRVRWEGLSKVLIKILHNVRKYHVVHQRDKNILRLTNGLRVYPVMPLKSLQRFFEYISLSTNELQKVFVPALIIHSNDDKIVHPYSAEYIYEHLGSDEKKLLWFDGKTHSLVVHKDRELMYTAVEKFIEKNN